MNIPLSAPYFSDELTVRFYECPECQYAHIPYGASAWNDSNRDPELDARYCPGCAAPIIWIAESP